MENTKWDLSWSPSPQFIYTTNFATNFYNTVLRFSLGQSFEILNIDFDPQYRFIAVSRSSSGDGRNYIDDEGNGNNNKRDGLIEFYCLRTH